MLKRNLRVVKWLGLVPVIATCTDFGRVFKAPLDSMKCVADSQQSLRVQFSDHECTAAVPDRSK